MISVLTMLVHLGATLRMRLASDNALVREQRYIVERHSRASQLLDEAKKHSYRYCEFVELNLKRLIPTHEEFDVLNIDKNGLDEAGYMKYTVRYRPTVRPVFKLFYTVKENSREQMWLGQNSFLQESLVEQFPYEMSKHTFVILSIRQRICWPRKRMTIKNGGLCTFEINFKNPLLYDEDPVKALIMIDVSKKYTDEHEGKYKGMYFQINGVDAFAQSDLTPLEVGVPIQICTVYTVGTVPIASHVAQKAQEVIAIIFGGSPSDYTAETGTYGCTTGLKNTCDVNIKWGLQKGSTMNKFAMKKSIKRANDNLPRLSKEIFGDGWTLDRVENRERTIYE